MSDALAEAYPLLFADDVGAIADWTVNALDLRESWRFENEAGVVEHAEVIWPGGRVSINLRKAEGSRTGPAAVALRIDDRARIDALHSRAVAAGADVGEGIVETRVAYSFTAVDPEGNEWWVNAETGFLDELRT